MKNMFARINSHLRWADACAATVYLATLVIGYALYVDLYAGDLESRWVALSYAVLAIGAAAGVMWSIHLKRAQRLFYGYLLDHYDGAPTIAFPGYGDDVFPTNGIRVTGESLEKMWRVRNQLYLCTMAALACLGIIAYFLQVSH